MPELICETVEDHYVLRDGASGMFLAASKFPKNRETRAPYIEELLPHKSEIDSKYNFLLEAPLEDDAGNKTLVRFSRKTKEQYVQTEIDKKATGWKSYHEGGKWVIIKPDKKAKTAKKKAAKKKTAKKAVKKD